MVFQILDIGQERELKESLGKNKQTNKPQLTVYKFAVCGPGRGTQADGDRLLELRWFLESGKDKLARVHSIGYWRGKSCSE